MADKLQWTEPRKITERKLREETYPGLKKMFRQCTRYYLMAVVPIGILCFFVNRPALLTSILTLAH